MGSEPQRRVIAIVALGVWMLGCGATSGPQDSVVRVEVVPFELLLQTAESKKLTANLYGQDNHLLEGRTVSWNSSNSTIASIDDAGTVTGLAAGGATITATSEGRSGTATIVVVPQVPTGAVIDILPALTYQTMMGWEGTAQIGQDECNRTAFNTYRASVINRLANELGINRVRLELTSGTENPVDWFTPYLAGQASRSSWRSHVYEIINDNADPQSINAAGFQFSALDYTVDQVVNPLRQALTARGERLGVNLTYVDFGNSAFEHASNPQEYAELMLAVFQHLQAKYGWVPDAVEIILEPDITSNWRPETIGPALVATGDRLKAAGFHPDFVTPSTTSMSNAVQYFDALMTIPRVGEYLTDLSYHRYSGVSDATLEAIAARARQFGIRTGMLEHIGSGHSDLYADLVRGRNSSWQQFTLAFCTGDNTGHYYWIDQSTPTNPIVTLSNAARFLRQYFLFVREGAVRIGAVSGDPQLEAVAFRHPNGNHVVVVDAHGGGSFQVRQLPAGTYGISYTTASEFAANRPDVTLTAGQTLSTSIPSAGVLTIYRR